MQYSRYQCWALLFAAVVLTGCSGREGIVPVSGTVTIDGTPVKMGGVRIYPEGGRPATGKIIDGNFKLSTFELDDGAPIGTHNATVAAVEQLTETSNRWYAPKSYANQLNSGLSVTIDGPTDNLEIKLTWEGSKQKGPFVDKF